MDKSAVCNQCGGLAKPPRSCNMCGSIVCGKCVDHNLGLCKLCMGKLGQKKKRF